MNGQRIEAAKAAAGIQEDTDTWNGWKLKGYEVIHGSRAFLAVKMENLKNFDTNLIQNLFILNLKRKN